jgi:hypothetical protein
MILTFFIYGLLGDAPMKDRVQWWIAGGLAAGSVFVGIFVFNLWTAPARLQAKITEEMQKERDAACKERDAARSEIALLKTGLQKEKESARIQIDALENRLKSASMADPKKWDEDKQNHRDLDRCISSGNSLLKDVEECHIAKHAALDFNMQRRSADWCNSADQFVMQRFPSFRQKFLSNASLPYRAPLENLALNSLRDRLLLKLERLEDLRAQITS